MKYFFKILFVILGICCIESSLGQNQGIIDSLKQVSSEAEEDSLEVIALNKLCWVLGYSRPGEALEYGNQALTLATKIDYKKGLAVSFNNIGVTYAYQAKYAQTSEYFLKSLEIHKEMGNMTRVAAVYNNIGEIHRLQGDYAKAIEN